MDRSLPPIFAKSETIENITTIEALGQVVYTYYAFFFIVASCILLIAMVGAIQLTLQKETPSKKQEAFEQNARDFTKTVVKITHKNQVSRGQYFQRASNLQ